MSWIYLFIASLFEMGWPFGLKMADCVPNYKIFWFVFACVTMILSGVFLYIAQKNIPIGTAYAVWTGVGTIGTFLLGIILFNDAASLVRFLAILLIISGIIILKLIN